MTDEAGRLQNKSNQANQGLTNNTNATPGNSGAGSSNSNPDITSGPTGRTMAWGGNLNNEISPSFVQSQLQGIKYPCSKEQLLNLARQQGLGDNVLNALNQLPNQKFSSVNDVVNAMGSTEL